MRGRDGDAGMPIEDFLNCIGKTIQLKKVNEVEWTLSIRDNIMLRGKLKVTIYLLEKIEITFRNPNGYGVIELNQGKIVNISYKGILESKIKEKLTQCSPILVDTIKEKTCF
jgi:hypothetical protein